jgi:VanZ family protein
MDKGLTFALFAALVLRVSQGLLPAIQSARAAWLITTIFAAALETGKVLFAGRSPRVDNLMLAMLGALAGVTLVPLIVRSRPVRACPELTLLGLATALLVYAELTPFSFAITPQAIVAKASRIEWLPLGSYFWTESHRALFDLWNKLLLSGFLGFAAAGALGGGRLAATALGLLLGGLLEGAQLFTVNRVPSVTDILIFGIGAYLGGTCHSRYTSCTFRQRTCLSADARRVQSPDPTQENCLTMQDFHGDLCIWPGGSTAPDSRTKRAQ